jgi:Uma2 family endonuclease
MTISGDLKLIPTTEYLEYPEEDDLPMPEGDDQREYLSYATKVLRIFFQNRQDVYVSGNLFIYYEKGKTEVNVAPDTFVVFGVDRHNRGSYKVWEEDGKIPQFVLEITSAATANRDRRDKPELYRQLGVQEYFQYDPTGKYLKPRPLQGMRLDQGKYVEIASIDLSDGVFSLFSEILNLELRFYPDRGLRFYNPVTGELLRSHEEEASERSLEKQARLQAEQQRSLEKQARLEAERERSLEKQARLEAEQKAQRLADRLRLLGINPDEV